MSSTRMVDRATAPGSSATTAITGMPALAAARALTAAGAGPIYLAGHPGELEGALKEAGVQDFIYVGCDVLATLRGAHDKLGLK